MILIDSDNANTTTNTITNVHAHAHYLTFNLFFVRYVGLPLVQWVREHISHRISSPLIESISFTLPVVPGNYINAGGLSG